MHHDPSTLSLQVTRPAARLPFRKRGCPPTHFMSLAMRGTRISPCLLRRPMSRPAAHAGAALQQYSSQPVFPSQLNLKAQAGLPIQSGPASDPASGSDPGSAHRSQHQESMPDTTASEAGPAVRQRRQNKWNWETHTSTFADLSVKEGPSRLPGIAKFLRLQELTDPPGMEFNLDTMLLSVHEQFPSRLHYVRDAKHHQVKPWVCKAMIQRAEAWQALDVYDLARIRRLGGSLKNNTSKRHLGSSLSHVNTLWNMAATVHKSNSSLTFSRHSAELGHELPPRVLSHMDGMVARDVQVWTEIYHRPGTPEESQTTSCIWVTINAPLRTASRNWETLARGQTPHADDDALAPILRNFGRWLQRTYRHLTTPGNHKSGPDKLSPSVPVQVARDTQDKASGRRHIRMPRGAVPDAVPVVFAWRQKYIWFLWTGGIRGKLVAQYASHWLPINEVDKGQDLDTKLKSSQEFWRPEPRSPEPELDHHSKLDEILLKHSVSWP